VALQGKIAIVTGGSRGIGAATARMMAARGASVIVNYVQNASAAENVVAEIRAAGGKAHAVQADVLDSHQVAHLITATLELYGRIDILVNNAASMRPSLRFLPLLQMKWEEFIPPVTAELKAAFDLTKAVAPIMIEQRYGRLIYIVSIRAKHPFPGGIVLGTAKAGIVAFTKYVAQELGPYGITANAIAPGITATGAIVNLPAEHKQQVLSMTPLGHIAKPDEIAGVIAFFADDDSGFMTGTCAPVNGGVAME
jgi:3-oxoacyl-[acyl-carrier protein] reductase